MRLFYDVTKAFFYLAMAGCFGVVGSIIWAVMAHDSSSVIPLHFKFFVIIFSLGFVGAISMMASYYAGLWNKK